MRHIFEEYGDVILQLLGGVGIIAILIDLLHSDGFLHGLVAQVIESAC